MSSESAWCEACALHSAGSSSSWQSTQNLLWSSGRETNSLSLPQEREETLYTTLQNGTICTLGEYPYPLYVSHQYRRSFSGGWGAWTIRKIQLEIHRFKKVTEMLKYAQQCHLSPSHDELLSRTYSELILSPQLNNKGADDKNIILKPKTLGGSHSWRVAKSQKHLGHCTSSPAPCREQGQWTGSHCGGI